MSVGFECWKAGDAPVLCKNLVAAGVGDTREHWGRGILRMCGGVDETADQYNTIFVSNGERRYEKLTLNKGGMKAVSRHAARWIEV